MYEYSFTDFHCASVELVIYCFLCWGQRIDDRKGNVQQSGGRTHVESRLHNIKKLISHQPSRPFIFIFCSGITIIFLFAFWLLNTT